MPRKYNTKFLTLIRNNYTFITFREYNYFDAIQMLRYNAMPCLNFEFLQKDCLIP